MKTYENRLPRTLMRGGLGIGILSLVFGGMYATIDIHETGQNVRQILNDPLHCPAGLRKTGTARIFFNRVEVADCDEPPAPANAL